VVGRVVFGGTVCFFRDIIFREVWSVGTCFVCGIVWWVRDRMCRNFGVLERVLCGGFYGGLEICVGKCGVLERVLCVGDCVVG
jgi:hypothetical protein